MHKFRRECEKLINEIHDITGSEKPKNKVFYFNLVRWSKDEPYWCVFACERGIRGGSGVKGAVNIRGHFCIGKEADLHEGLTILSDSGWDVEIHKDFFQDR